VLQLLEVVLAAAGLPRPVARGPGVPRGSVTGHDERKSVSRGGRGRGARCGHEAEWGGQRSRRQDGDRAKLSPPAGPALIRWFPCHVPTLSVTFGTGRPEGTEGLHLASLGRSTHF